MQTILFSNKNHKFKGVITPSVKPLTFMKHPSAFILFSLLCWASTSFAQNKKQPLIDSLQAIVQKNQRDTLQVRALNELAWIYRNDRYEQAINYGTQAEKLALQLKDNRGIVTAYNRLGVVLKIRGDYNAALNYYKKALKIEEKANHQFGIYRSLNYIGVVLKRKRQYKKAIKYFEKGIVILKKINKPQKIATPKLNLAVCYKNLGNIQKATQSYLEAIPIFQKDKKAVKVAKCHLGLGHIYQITKIFELAEEYLQKALAVFKEKNNKTLLIKVYHELGFLYLKTEEYDLALDFYSKNLTLRRELKNYQDIQMVHNNIGLIHLNLSRLDKAKESFLKSQQVSKKNKDTLTLAWTLNNLGYIQKLSKNYPKAIQYFEQSLLLANKISAIFIRKKVLINLSSTYAAMNNYKKALEHYERFKQVDDSLENSFRRAVKSEKKYQEEKKKREILERDQKIQQGKIFQQTIINYALGIGLLLTLMVVLAMIKSYRDRLKVRRHQKKIDDLLREQEFLALNNMLEGQDQERNRIAQDLHDRLGGMLSVVKLHFEALNQSSKLPNIANVPEYVNAMQQLDNACDSIRSVSHNISSKSLQRFGLVAALKDLTTSIEQAGSLAIDLVDTGFENNQRLPVKIETQVYRIVQELISNVLKHAEASEMEIQLYRKKNELYISVEDNGKGFDVAKAQEKKSLGLAGISARIEALAGKYSIDSREGQGTAVMIDIPLEEKPLTELPKKHSHE